MTRKKLFVKHNISGRVENKVGWRLFLDDLRFPSDQRALIARSDDEGRRMVIERGGPSFISFDFHLGDGCATGLDFAKWLVEMDQSGRAMLPEDFSFEVHSSDPVGTRKIRELMLNHLRRDR
jgi:hypothetical protein